MSVDDDTDCVEHVWRMAGATLVADGAHIDYLCARCGGVMVEGPDDV